MQLRGGQLGEYRFNILYTVKRFSTMSSFSAYDTTHLPPLMVSHEGFPVICNKWWLYMNRIRVLAGKSMAHTSGGVLHTAAVMG
jgi:hypothetical protein